METACKIRPYGVPPIAFSLRVLKGHCSDTRYSVLLKGEIERADSDE